MCAITTSPLIGASDDHITIVTEVVMAAENGAATLLAANLNLWVEPEKVIEAITETTARGLRD